MHGDDEDKVGEGAAPIRGQSVKLEKDASSTFDPRYKDIAALKRDLGPAAISASQAFAKVVQDHQRLTFGSPAMRSHFDALESLRVSQRSLAGQSLADVVEVARRSMGYVEEAHRATRGWSTLLKDIRSTLAIPGLNVRAGVSDMADLSRTISAIYPDLTMRSLAETRSIHQPHGAMQWAADIVKLSNDMRRIQTDLRSAMAPLSQLLEKVRRNHLDLSSLVNRSLTGMVAASLAASAPHKDAATSTLEMMAVASAAFQTTPDPAAWREARQHSILIDALSFLHEAEDAPIGGEAFERAIDRLGDRFEAAIANAPQPSQKLAAWSLLVSVISVVLTIITILQASDAGERELDKPDVMSVVVDQLVKNGAELNEIADRLEADLSKTERIVALRYANIRVAPTKSSKIIGKMLAGDLAIAHETAKGWRRVEIADPLTNRITTGWVYSKFTAEVE